jgi:hypothetical protein
MHAYQLLLFLRIERPFSDELELPQDHRILDQGQVEHGGVLEGLLLEAGVLKKKDEVNNQVNIS